MFVLFASHVERHLLGGVVNNHEALRSNRSVSAFVIFFMIVPHHVWKLGLAILLWKN